MNDLTGYYLINETWQLWLNNELENVHVEYIHVEKRERENRYEVKHFDRYGELIKSLTLDKEDLELVKISTKEKVEKPSDI